MQEMLEATEAASREGRFAGSRLPRLSDLALVLIEYRRELGVPRVHPMVVKMVLSPLAWVARSRRVLRRSRDH
jgi:hypothetical protein